MVCCIYPISSNDKTTTITNQVSITHTIISNKTSNRDYLLLRYKRMIFFGQSSLQEISLPDDFDYEQMTKFTLKIDF